MPPAIKIPLPAKRASAFTELGMPAVVGMLKKEIQELYQADDVPWIIGYSGGKDSTAILQLIWLALRDLPAKSRTKTVHVITTDTLVENPIVASWVGHSHRTMAATAQAESIPIVPHILQPRTEDSFWVSLIGKGYPAPRPKLRWCTDRMKIRPSNTFIKSCVNQHGQAIIVLGARKAESSARARVLNANTKYRVQDRLSPNPTLAGCMVYTPIEDWSNDDVWMFLMQVDNPWKHSNKDLLTMYAGATADGECPLVVDTSTPSCGDSRFGCWVCTMVSQDKSMSAMIQNDKEKEWMRPLIKLRNELDVKDDSHLRDFRRMIGTVTIMENGAPVPGPYKQDVREHWLERLLEAQTWIRANGPEVVRDLVLITVAELEEIRRIWVMDKHELEDHLPGIYERVTGARYPGRPLDDNLVVGAEDMRLLEELCGKDRLHYELTRGLIDIARRNRNLSRRQRIFEDLESAFKRGYYDSKEDAIGKARKHQQAVKQAQEAKKILQDISKPEQTALPLTPEEDPT